MIVPLKILQGYHGNVSDRDDDEDGSSDEEGGVNTGNKTKSAVSILFHPKQPWIFSAGLDGVINLFQDI